MLDNSSIATRLILQELSGGGIYKYQLARPSLKHSKPLQKYTIHILIGNHKINWQHIQSFFNYYTITYLHSDHSSQKHNGYDTVHMLADDYVLNLKCTLCYADDVQKITYYLLKNSRTFSLPPLYKK